MTASAPAAVFDLKSLDGASVGSQELAGKVVLLNFWATWCGPCKEEMPSLARLQSQFDPGQVRVVTVTADMHPQGIKQFFEHLGINLPVLFDEDQELSRRFMVRGLPTTVLIGQNGHAIGRAVGPRSWDSRESIALVREVLEHQP
jgi:thiol-disulfide isomerase/thioredoxin